MDYHLLKRKQLQQLCKKHGIPANLKNLDMANRLSSLLINEEKSENVRADENGDVDGKEEKKEEKLEKAVRRGKSCLKSVGDVVDSKEVKRVKFSPENQMFLFEKTDPRAMRLLGRKKRAFLELREEDNPVVVCANSVESQSLGVILDDVGRGGRRNVRRKSVVVSDAGVLVGQNDEKVNGGNLQRNLRSQRGKKKQESGEVVSLVSPGCVDEVENVVEGQNLRRSSRQSMVVRAEDVGFVTENSDQVVKKSPVKRGLRGRNLRSLEREVKQESIERASLVSPCGVDKVDNVERKRNSRRSMVVQSLGFVTENANKVENLPVKRGAVEQNLRSQKGKSKQESTEAVLLMSPCVVNKVEDVLQGPNLRRNLRSSMFVRAEDLELVTENAVEVETLPSKGRVMDRNLRSRAGKAKQDNREVVSLVSPCAVSKVEDVLKGPNLRKSMLAREEDLSLVTENADEVEKLPPKREIINRNLRSRAGKANQETVQVVSLLPPSGNENVEKPVEGGILKRSLRPRGGKSKENDVEVVPSLSVDEENKKKGIKDKGTVEEGGDGGMIVDGRNEAIDCKIRTKRGRRKKSVMAVENVKPIGDTSISKGEEHHECRTEDVVETHNQHSVETILENKSKNRSWRKTSILKRQKSKDFNEDSSEKPDAVKADHLSSGSTADNIVLESAQPEDESCEAATGSFPVEQKTECFSEALPFSASGSQQLPVTYNTMPLVDYEGEKISIKEVVKSAEPIAQTLANDNTSTPLSQSTSDVGANKVQEIPSEVLASDYSVQEENTTLTVSNHRPSLRSIEAQYDNLTSELLEQANSCKDFESSLHPLLSEDAIFNTVESRVLESERDDNTEDLQDKTISQSGQLTVDTSLSEHVVDDNKVNKHQTVDSAAAYNLSVSRKSEVAEPYLATGDSIQKEQSSKHVEEVTEFTSSSSLQVNLEHEATQSGECYEEKGTLEKSSEKAQLNSLTPAKDNALTPSVMQKSNNVPSWKSMEVLYDKLTDEHMEQTSNCRTFESEEDDYADKLQDTKTLTNFETNNELVDVKLVNECSDAKEYTMKIGSNKHTKEFASGGSTTECIPSDRKETNVAGLDHAIGNSVEFEFKEDSFEEATKLSPRGSLQLSLAHDMPQSETNSEAVGTLENSSRRPEVSSQTSAKINNYGEEVPLEMPAVGDNNTQEDNALTPLLVARWTENKTSSSSIIDHKRLDASHTIENCETLNVVKDELFSSLSKSDGRVIEGETFVRNVGFFKALDSENNMGDTMLDPSDRLIVQLTEQEKMERSMTGCGSISHGTDRSSCGKQLNEFTYIEKEHETVDSTAACNLSVSPELEVADSFQMTQSVSNVKEVTQFPQSGSLQLNLSHESKQSKECDEEKGNTIKTSKTAQLNHLTPAKSNNFSPLRSMEIQCNMSPDERMEHSSNCRTFESSLKHLFAGDFILNTDESNDTNSEKDDSAEHLQGTLSVRQVPETKLDASLGEQVADDNERVSMDNIDANNESMESRECTTEIGYDNTKEFISAGLTTDSSPSNRKKRIVSDASGAVDISSVSQAMGENCETLNDDKDQQFSSLGELDGKMMESETFESSEDLVREPDSENNVGDMVLNVSALIDDKLTIQLIEQEEIARSMRESDSVSKGIDCDEQLNEFISVEKVVVTDCSDEGEVQSPTTAKESEDIETVMPLQDGDCRSEVPISESSLSAKTSFMHLPEVVEASKAVDCSSISQTLEENWEALNAGEEQLFSSMSELGGRMIEDDTFDGKEGCVKAPESLNEMDDTVLEAATSFDHKFGVHLTEQEEVARAMAECDIVSFESSGVKPANENAFEGRGLSPSSELETTETATLLQNVEADCISKKPVLESDLAAETSFFHQPKVFGEPATILSSMKKGEDRSKETSGDIACSKTSCVDNLALVDRQPALKLAEDAHNSIELNAQQILAEDHLINFDGERTSEPKKALTATEHNMAVLGDKGLSISSQDSKLSEIEFHFSSNDCSPDLNSLFTELDVMSQAGESVPCMPEDKIYDTFGVLFDHCTPQACNNLKHVQDDKVTSIELEEMHHQETSEAFLYHTNDNLAGTEESHSSGRIETNTGESEEILGGQDFKEADVMHHAIEALKDGSGNKRCTEADSEVTDSRITQQNSNENQVDDQTHTVQDDACNSTYHLLVSQQTGNIENLPHKTSEASDDGTYIHEEKSLNSEAMKQHNKDEDSVRAQNVMAVDATDDDNTKLMRRSLLIHGTPKKPVLPQHDMKENMLAPKRSQMVNATTTKPMLKRKALDDI